MRRRFATASLISFWVAAILGCCLPGDDKPDKPKGQEGNGSHQPSPGPPSKAQAAEDVLAPTEARLRITIPELELPADAPPEVRKYAETLVALERAKIVALAGDVVEGLPGQRPDEAKLRAEATKLATQRRKAAEVAHADATVALDAARAGAAKKAVDDATEEAKRRYPIPKDGPAIQRVKAQRDYDENAPKMIEAARQDAERRYAAPVMPKKKK